LAEDEQLAVMTLYLFDKALCSAVEESLRTRGSKEPAGTIYPASGCSRRCPRSLTPLIVSTIFSVATIAMNGTRSPFFHG
jgi:hypothetical protein